MSAAPPPARPLYLDVADDAVYGTFHAPAEGAASGVAVLICPAWGWDEVTTYRSRREWAERLALGGHPTLRIDLQGAGDSAGTPRDADLVEAWTAAIASSATWLAAVPGVTRVAAICLGLSGLIAGQAIVNGAPIDDIALWAAPIRGRAFLREQRAFAALQSSRLGLADDVASSVGPEGGLEVGGFVMASETMTAIERLDLQAIALGRLRRALLLGRDGLPVDADLQRDLRGSGVEVEVANGDGWGAMCLDLERYQPPVAVFDRVATWLAEATGLEAGRPMAIDRVAGPRVDDHADLAIGGSRIRESPTRPDDRLGESFGVLAVPLDAAPTKVCAVFLNAGAIRRIGPNRLWVEAARRWAARGVPVLRVDVEGIGDAEGDARIYADVGRFYTPDREDQVISIMDALEARGFGPRFVLMGLCAGAYSAFNTAAIDDRVISAVVINPRVLVWDPGLLARREARLVKRVLTAGSWRRILSGQTTPAQVLGIARTAALEAWRALLASPGRLRDRGRPDVSRQRLEAILDRLRDNRVRVVLAFSGEEPVHEELGFAGILARLDRWPNVLMRALPETDHTLRPMAAQRACLELLDGELEQLLADRRETRPEHEGHGQPATSGGVP